MDIGALSRLDHFRLGGVGLAVEDVVADRSREQEHVLLNDSDAPSDRFERERADVLAVDHDRAVLRPQLVEIRKQVAERRLAAAGGTDEGKFLAFFDVERDVVEHFFRRVVRVGDVFEVDNALHVLKLLRAGCVGLGLFVHDLDEALEARGAVLVLLHEVDQRVHGAYEKVHGHDERRVVAERDSPRIEEQSARDQDYYVEHVRDELGGREEPRHRFVGAARGADEFLVALLELFDLPRRVRVRFCDADSRDAALDRRVDRRVALAPVFERLPHPLPEVKRHPHEDRNAREDDQRQQRLDAHQVRERQNYHHRTDQKVFGAVVGQLAHLKKVAGNSRHQAPGLVVVVKAEGQLLQVVEQVGAHLRLHSDADHVAIVLHEVPQQHPDHIENEHGCAGDHDGGVHLFGNVFVEHFVRDDRVDHSYERNKQ